VDDEFERQWKKWLSYFTSFSWHFRDGTSKNHQKNEVGLFVYKATYKPKSSKE